MALPLFAVSMPANILFVKQVIDEIINFQPIPKDTLYEYIGEPIFGHLSSGDESVKDISDQLDDEEDDEEEKEVTDGEEITR